MCDYEYENLTREFEACPYYDGKKYGRVMWEGREYCIFHAPIEPKKDRIGQFWESFVKLIGEFNKKGIKIWDFEGFVFPDTEYRFLGDKFPKDVRVNFSWAQFSGEAIFYAARFSGYADFERAQFSGKANFERAQFSGEADFEQAQFSKEADFSFAKFCEDADFSEAQFSRETGFIEAKFSGEADFSEAQFSGEVIFFNAQFFANGDFGKVQFSERAVFNRAIVLHSLLFNYARFSQVLSFTGAKMGSVVDFSSADLHSQVNFRGADISSLNCSGAVFRIPPYFGDVGTAVRVVYVKNFVGELTLEFERGWRELYIDKSDIKNKIIKQKEEEKSVELVVEGGKISGLFTIRAPLKSIHMSGAAFPATMSIAPKDKQKKPSFTAEKVSFLGDTSIEDVMVEGIRDCIISGNMRIIESDLSKAHFERVDLSRIDFENVKWIELLRSRSSFLATIPRLIFRMVFLFRKCRNRRFFCRKTLALNDEIVLGKDEFCQKKNDNKSMPKKNRIYAPSLLKVKNKDDLRKIEEFYRQIASSYESRRRYGLAGHFKASEFEIRRRYVGCLEKIILLFYRWSSFYGEEVVKPFFLLLSLPFVSAFLFLWLAYGWNLSWESIRHFNTDGFGIWREDFSEALTCGLQGLIPAFNYPADYPKLLSTIIGLAEKLFAALFTSLFLFALRRRVKR